MKTVKGIKAFRNDAATTVSTSIYNLNIEEMSLNLFIYFIFCRYYFIFCRYYFIFLFLLFYSYIFLEK